VLTQEEQKKMVGEKALEFVRDGMAIGLGTGSTARYFIEGLGRMVQEGFCCTTIATSVASENLAESYGIPKTTFTETPQLDLVVDGADEIDTEFTLIKGGGGALLREKIVASISKHMVVIADSSKYVPVLGSFPLPIEIVQYGWEASFAAIQQLSCIPILRQREGKPYLTDNGNFIVDAKFSAIHDPQTLESALRHIPGVVECGLFIGFADTVILGSPDGPKVLSSNRK